MDFTILGISRTRLTRIADRLADLTGMGEAIFGAVLLGAATSLSGSVTSMVLLCIPLLTALTPAISFAGVHPAFIVILVYLIGLHLMKQARSGP